MKRRAFLQGGVATAGLVAASGLYLFDQDMKPAPPKRGYVLCDLHAHPQRPSDEKSLEETIAVLGSPGLVGLTQRPDATEILTYEEACRIIERDPNLKRDFAEITPRQLAKFRRGYFARTEEIDAGGPDIIAIGFNGDYLQNYGNPIEAITAIQERDGVAVYSTPYTINNKRVATSEEEGAIFGICLYTDLFEVHDAHNINFLWFLMHESNRRAALALAENRCYNPKTRRSPWPFASSDAHRELNQIKITGVYVKEEALQSMDLLKGALRNGNFIVDVEPDNGPYVSRFSFIRGIVIPKIERVLGFNPR